MSLSVDARLILASAFIYWSVLQGTSDAALPDLSPAPTSVIARPEKPGPLRTWTRSDGARSKPARFLQYDALTGIANFERQNGRPATTSLSALSDADRRFIASELGDAPFEYSGLGIAPPPDSPTAVTLARTRVLAVGSNSPLVLASGATRGFGGAGMETRETQTSGVTSEKLGPRLVTLKAAKQPPGLVESIPTPSKVDSQLQGEGTGASYVWPRVVFYGCRGTWHLIDGMGTASYQFRGQWWLTALKESTSPAGWWYYQESPMLNNTRRFWAFRLRNTPCGYVCGHGCGCWHHHHHYGFEVWLWHDRHWHLHDCAHVVRMRPFGYGSDDALTP